MNIDSISLLFCSEMRRYPKPTLTIFQRFVFVTFGAVLAAGGAASLLAGKILFHASQENFGWIFAPFAVVLGVLMIFLALRLGKQVRRSSR
jgi:hypothetical protein